MSVRLKLALSYAGIAVAAGIRLLTAVGCFFVGDLSVFALPRGPISSDLLRAFVPIASGSLLLLGLLGLGAGWALSGRVLAPLISIGHAARLVSQGALAHRIALSGPVDEYRDIADAFNSMLEQIEAQRDGQRRFTADASHELRTPLAITKTLLDVARTDPERNVPVLLARLEEVNARSIALSEALLLLSQVEQRSFDSRVVDLSLVAEEAVETLLDEAEHRHVHVEIHPNAASVSGSAALLQRLADALVHNAIVHNLPAGGSIWVRTHANAGAVTFEVENTGKVLPPDQVVTLSEPFQRRTGRARQEAYSGFGLGLAIAQRITEAHDGSLYLTPREGGGLTVKAVFPKP